MNPPILHFQDMPGSWHADNRTTYAGGVSREPGGGVMLTAQTRWILWQTGRNSLWL